MCPWSDVGARVLMVHGVLDYSCVSSVADGCASAGGDPCEVGGCFPWYSVDRWFSDEDRVLAW